MKRYSVLIPAYNAEKYIVECVESVIGQFGGNYKELFNTIELIIANDGSLDSTGDICEELAKKYSNIKVYHKKNEGALLTRNFLLEKAESEYIIYLDADDKWEKDLLQNLDVYIEQYGHPDIISFGFNLWQGTSYLPCVKFDKLLFCDKTQYTWALLLCEDTFNSLWSKAIKREILLKSNVNVSLQNINRGDDKLRLIACFEVARNILFIPEKFYDYRIDNSSMTRTFKLDYFDEVIMVDKFALEKLIEHTSGEKKYLIKWGENLMQKYIEYILSALSSFPKGKALEYINKYISDETVKKAISYAKKSKSWKAKIKANIVSLRLYNILNFVYQRRQ